MQKRFAPILATILQKRFSQDICLIENRHCIPTLQGAVTQKREVPNPMFLHFSQSPSLSLSVTIAKLVVWMSQRSYNVNI